MHQGQNAVASSPNVGIVDVQSNAENYEIGTSNQLPYSFSTQDNPSFMAVALGNQKPVPPSFAAGIQNVAKNITELLQSTLTEMVEASVDFNNPHEELEKVKNKYRKRLDDLKYDHDMEMKELREDIKKMKKKFEEEIRQVVEETKKKIWCANCGNEALYFCCLVSSYCGVSCQENHWMTHVHSCRSVGAAT